MRILILFSFFAIQFSTITQGQPVPVKGTVKIQTGYPIAGVSVIAKKEKREVLTDSSGGFDFKVSPYSVVVLEYDGYEDVELKVNDKPIDTVIILYPDKSQPLTNDAFAARSKAVSFESATSTGVSNSLIYGGSINSSGGTFFPQFQHKEETQGSRYLFTSWVKGSVVDIHDTLINSPMYRYNYDKINATVLFTTDGQSAVTAEKSMIKSFVLEDADGNSMRFRYVPAIDQKLFVHAVAEGQYYNFYKLTRTKFVKSNYRSDGMTSTGNPYDEYTDETFYYIENVKTKHIDQIRLKRKELRMLLADQKQKLEEYFHDNSDRAVDQEFVAGLIDHINK